MADKIFPTDVPSKANPTTSDILLIADVADNSELKKITIGDITTDIGAGLIVDGSESATTTYSSVKINDLNDAQDTTISGNYNTLNTNKLNRNAQLRTGNGAWKTTYNDGSGNEVELALGTAGYVLNSNGASAAPTWVAPSVNISGQTEDTAGDMDADFALVYDASAAANRKQKMNVYRATNAEVNTGTATNKFITPAGFASVSPVRKIYSDASVSGTGISTSLTPCLITTLPSGITASTLVVKIDLGGGNASSGDGTINIKIGGTTVYTYTTTITSTNSSRYHEVEIMTCTDTKVNVVGKIFIPGGASALYQQRDVTVPTLSSAQEFRIDAIRSGSGGSFIYYGSSLIKL